MQWRSSASWRASAARIASACASQSRVLPSTSAKSSVTVPVGTFAIVFCRPGWDGLRE
jgi:hypothetical protein